MPQRTVISNYNLVIQHQALPMIYPKTPANFCIPWDLDTKDPFNQYLVKDAIGYSYVSIYFTGCTKIGDPE
jgi:hypothetical protein